MGSATRINQIFVIALGLFASECAFAAETLQDAWRIAEQNNHAVLASRLHAKAAHQNTLAVAAQKWPTAQAKTGFISRSSEPSFVGSQPALGINSLSLPFAQRNAGRFSAGASVPLWTARRLEHTEAAARSRQYASYKKSAWLENEIRYAVAEAFFAVLRAQHAMVSAKQYLDGSNAHARELTEAERQNRIEHRQVLAATVQVRRAEQALLTSRNAHVDACATYNQLLGRRVSTPFELAVPVVTRLQGSIEELTALATSHRPDILQLNQVASGFANDAAAWRASKRPQVSAEVGFVYEENQFQSPQGLGTAGLVVDWKFFDAGLRQRRAQESDRRAAAIRQEQEELRSQIAVEVLRSWNERTEAIPRNKSPRPPTPMRPRTRGR